MKPNRRPVAEWLTALGSEAATTPIKQHVFAGLTPADDKQLKSQDISVYHGKVRDVLKRGDELLVVHSDRLTAFDRLIDYVPYKGVILTAISEYWLKEASKVVPTHYRHRPHDRILTVESLEPIKTEVVVRAYLAGSLMRAYEQGERVFCGQKLPDGLSPYCQLPKPLITPTTKAAAFEHDENTSAERLIEMQVVTAAEWATISAMALKLFAHGQKIFQEKGWMLVDTKYEFGRTAQGDIKVIDEVHTPDSSRLWIQSSYASRMAQSLPPEMLDKEIVRRYLLDQGFSGYGDVPPVPASKLLELAHVYLTVGEALIGAPILAAAPEHEFLMNYLPQETGGPLTP